MHIKPLTEHVPIPERDDEQRVGIFIEQSGSEVTLCPRDPPSGALVVLPESPHSIRSRKHALCEMYKCGILTVDEFRAKWDELPY